MELRPEDLGKPFFLSPKIAQGLGENGLFGGLMVGRWQPWGRSQVVEFRRIANQVQMVARNDQFTAAAGTPEAVAVKAAFSDSLLGSAAVASQPHPDSKAILIDANALFLTDLLGMGMTLQRQYRQSYAFDKANETMLRVQAHYSSPTLAQPQPGAAPGSPQPTLPSTLPDVRSLFLTLHYSLVRLPAEPMKPRRADPRVGYFNTAVDDFGNDQRLQPRQRFINRWRLEKILRHRCPSRSSRSPSGWTATSRSSTATPSPAACWAGTWPSSASASRTRWWSSSRGRRTASTRWTWARPRSAG
jgi:Domain of unknown function (DUF5117)